ncbi:MAG: T9SS type A sorting domain-containing protein [Mucilaginibacter sp.]
MKRTVLIIFATLLLCRLPAQNLVTNPDAESLPRGTGWTIISQGALTCSSPPTDNMLNWTMKPDGSANYPYDHTTGASGGTVFYSGCDTYFTGPFELQQTIDVSADAATIDLLEETYTFSGYMQSPVSNQTDAGRFVVDFLDASNSVLGTSYTSNWQSYFGGSGAGWKYYNDSRIAPVGTRKIRIRMQTKLYLNRPAINVYFDDISLTRTTVLPLNLLSFTGSEVQGKIHLSWTISPGMQPKQFDLERSIDATNFERIATIPSGKTSYQFIDVNNDLTSDRYYYRLKMTDLDGNNVYSNIVTIRISAHVFINLSPNPANDIVTVNGSFGRGIILLINSTGQTVLSANVDTPPLKLDVSRLPAGLYVLRFISASAVINRKLLISPR